MQFAGSTRTVALVLALLGMGLLLPFLGASDLWDPWEPRYSQAAREMAERGDPVVPYYVDEPRLNRPPMSYWLIGASQSLFGVNETAARLPSALLAVACSVALGLAFALRGRALEGFLCGAALLTAPQWLLCGRFAMPAMPMAAMLGLVLAVAIAFQVLKPSARKVCAVSVVLLLSAAALTDWPRGLLLPAWAVLGWAATERRRGPVVAFLVIAAAYHAAQLTYNVPLNVVVWGALLATAGHALVRFAGLPVRVVVGAAFAVAALVAPWFLAVLGHDALKVFEYKYLFNLGEGPGDHTGPYSFVVRMLLIGGLAWAAPACAGLARGLSGASDGIARICAGSLIGGLTFYLLAEARMGYFTVALQPAMAGLAAIGLLILVRERGRWWIVPTAILAASAFLFWSEPSSMLESGTVRRNLYGLDLRTPVLICMAAWTLVVAMAAVRKRESWLVAAGLPAAILAGFLGWWVVPSLGPSKSLGPIWKSYVATTGPDGAPIGMYGASRSSGYYYGDGRLVRLDDSRELRGFLAGPGERYLIVPIRTLAKLEQTRFSRGDHWERVGPRHPTHALVRYRSGT